MDLQFHDSFRDQAIKCSFANGIHQIQIERKLPKINQDLKHETLKRGGKEWNY